MQIYKTLENLQVSRETFNKLQEYVFLLQKWNKSINLVSSHDIDNVWEKHILLCAELIQYIPSLDDKIIDLGSGSGLPGIVLSIMGVKDITLIEANSKKAAFLLQASQISGNNIKVINDRIERQNLNCNIVTSRALASVSTLLELSQYVKFTNCMLLLKGANPEKEINFSKKFNFDILRSKYNENSSIVLVKKIVDEQ